MLMLIPFFSEAYGISSVSEREKNIRPKLLSNSVDTNNPFIMFDGRIRLKYFRARIDHGQVDKIILALYLFS